MKTVVKLVLLMALVPALGYTQTEGEDIIELKDGTAHRGVVIEQHPGQLIRLLQLPSGDTLTIPVSDIAIMRKIIMKPNEKEILDTTNVRDTINMDTVKTQTGKQFNRQPTHVGFYYSVGGGDWSSQALGLDLHYMLTHRFQVGMGIEFRGGLSNYNTPVYYTFPLSVLARYKLKDMWKQRGALVFDGGIGYHFINGSYPVGADYAELKNGLYLTSGLGLRVNISKETGFLFGLGYQLIRTGATLNGAIIKHHNYSSATARIGFFF